MSDICITFALQPFGQPPATPTRTGPDQAVPNKAAHLLKYSHSSSSPDTRRSHPNSPNIAIMGPASRPIHRRPSLINPRVDIEDSAPEVCPSCRLRRRSSAETAELRSPKHVHTVLDKCCGRYCPDITLSQAEYPQNARPRIGHSRLSGQLQGPGGFAGDQSVGSQCPSDPSGKQPDRAHNGWQTTRESDRSNVQEDGKQHLGSSRFQPLAILATS